MTPLGAGFRLVHLAAALSLVGIFTLLLLAGRSDRPTALGWERRMFGCARWLAGLVPLSGLALLGYQVAHVAGRSAAALEPASWLTLLLETRFGTVWLVRHGVVLLLAALILLRERERSAADWTAYRAEVWLLGAAATGAAAWAGHAAAVEPGGLAAALGDALHLVAAGAWLGALPPLSLLLWAAAREAGADSRPFAVLAVRRFSAVALPAMLILIATGLWNAWNQVGDFAPLVGTPYGGLLLLKLSLLLPILALAVFNRRRLLPALSGDGPAIGRPAMARLGRLVALEWTLGLAIIAVVSLLSVTPPGRHDTPWWPFAHRLSWEATGDLPGVRIRVLLGSQIAFLGVLGGVVAWLFAKRRAALVAGGMLALVAGSLLSLPPLAVDAYPTTYRRPTVPYHALSVASGLTLYRAHCALCHGLAGRGDGPGGQGLARRPADLTGPHTAQHTAGDLFWWLTQGIPPAGMPGFGGRLLEEERWDLINFVRALSAAQQARTLSPAVAPNRLRLAAPDFTFSVGPGPGRGLKDFRGKRPVLLVLFTLPGSRDRLALLARRYESLRALGVEILAAPFDGGERIISRLGAEPPILFPVVTEGSHEIALTYALFRRTLGPEGTEPDAPVPPHMEFLIDRGGYLRGRWIPGGPGPGWAEPAALAAELAQLGREGPAPPPDEHVH